MPIHTWTCNINCTNKISIWWEAWKQQGISDGSVPHQLPWNQWQTTEESMQRLVTVPVLSLFRPSLPCILQKFIATPTFAWQLLHHSFHALFNRMTECYCGDGNVILFYPLAKFAPWDSRSWYWKWEALTVTFKVILPFRLKTAFNVSCTLI